MERSGSSATTAAQGVLAARYQLGEVIGRGGMAEVYRATDLKFGRPVAVKLLLDGAGDDDDRARFITEARTLAMLSHSGLVMVLDAGFGTAAGQRPAPSELDQPFLVMELVDGPTLRQVMRGGPMPLPEVARVGAQVADALGYVHAQGVVHRDVKPGNVLLGEDGRTRLADFGIAHLVGQTTRHTATGLALGTAAYIAPEQVRGGEVAGAADVYALGLVLLEAITGRREYDGAPTEAAMARLHRPPAFPSTLPARWRALLAAMTALDPHDRPAASEVAQALQAESVPSAPVVAPEDVPTEPFPTTSAPPSPPTAAAPAPPRTPAIDRSGDAVARQVRRAAGRVRSLSADTWGVVGAAVALLVLLVAAALASGTDNPPVIPDDTPAELREPLTDLHVAIHGEDG